MAKKKRALGRGLSSLMAEFADEAGEAPSSEPSLVKMVATEKLFPNPHQPRREFALSQLKELAASLREKGVIHPLVVRLRPRSEDASGDLSGLAGDPNREYEIVAGERRWKAAQMAQLHELPVLVRDLNDGEAMEIAIIENIQRADLNPIEEALGYKALIEKLSYTQDALATRLGKSRSHIANQIRLLTLPTSVQALLRGGHLHAGHARALIPSDHAEEIARHVVGKNLSVRQTEQLVKKYARRDQSNSDASRKPSRRTPYKDADARAIEEDLSANIGMRVSIDHRERYKSGHITIHYTDTHQLDWLCQILGMPRK